MRFPIAVDPHAQFTIAKETLDRLIAEMDVCAEEDANLGTPDSEMWWFLTSDEVHALRFNNRIPTVVVDHLSNSLGRFFGYELFLTLDDSKRGRQRDAFELVYSFDTYPDYPRVTPQ